MTSWNAASERMFGYPASDAVGHSVVDLIAYPETKMDASGAVAAAAAGEVSHRKVDGDGPTTRSSTTR